MHPMLPTCVMPKQFGSLRLLNESWWVGRVFLTRICRGNNLREFQQKVGRHVEDVHSYWLGLIFHFFETLFFTLVCVVWIFASGFLCLSVPPPSSTRLSTSMRRRAPPSQDFTRHRGQGFLTGTRKDAFLLIVCKMMGLFFLTTSHLNTVGLDVWVPYFLWIGIGGTVWYRIF